MGKIFALDNFYQERTIRSQFLFRLSVPTPSEKGYDYVVLLDRDGTIIKEKKYLRDSLELEFEDKAQEALKVLADFAVFVAVVSNQAGLAKGIISFQQFTEVNHRFLLELQEHALPVHAVVYCPFHEDGTVDRYACRSSFRKPETGMYRIIKQSFSIDPKMVFVVGDKVSDVEFGNKLQAHSYLLTTGHGNDELAQLERTNLSYKVKANLYDAVADILDHLTMACSPTGSRDAVPGG